MPYHDYQKPGIRRRARAAGRSDPFDMHGEPIEPPAPPPEPTKRPRGRPPVVTPRVVDDMVKEYSDRIAVFDALPASTLADLLQCSRETVDKARPLARAIMLENAGKSNT